MTQDIARQSGGQGLGLSGHRRSLGSLELGSAARTRWAVHLPEERHWQSWCRQRVSMAWAAQWALAQRPQDHSQWAMPVRSLPDFLQDCCFLSW